MGGTNPSLLEAMASECFILAHDNIFNRAVLKDNSLYYPNAEKVTEMLNDIENICTQHKKNFTDGTALYQVWAIYTTRNGKEIFLEIWRNMHFVRYYPAEALSEPIFRTWHFFWRMNNKK